MRRREEAPPAGCAGGAFQLQPLSLSLLELESHTETEDPRIQHLIGLTGAGVR